jgi:2-oxoglutarate dehydrogenase complex dehydrogenase (E1) component-like enzyme
LFPLPAQLKEIIAKYPNADDYVSQEEPKNMGAYSFMLMNFNLVKWRLASLKAILHQLQEVLQELNVVWQTQYEWF